MDFGEQPAKQASEPRRVTITNGGQSALYVNSVTVEGEHAEEFALVSDRCTGSTLGPGKSCVVDVVLTPAAVERRTASLTITGNSGVTTQRVDLSGTGINSAAVPPR